MKKTFKQIAEEAKAAKPLKRLEKNTPLPYVFDLHWDAKKGKDLENLKGNKLVQQFLAENGFDVQEWLSR